MKAVILSYNEKEELGVAPILTTPHDWFNLLKDCKSAAERNKVFPYLSEDTKKSFTELFTYRPEEVDVLVEFRTRHPKFFEALTLQGLRRRQFTRLPLVSAFLVTLNLS
jgi:hypothetical protein